VIVLGPDDTTPMKFTTPVKTIRSDLKTRINSLVVKKLRLEVPPSKIYNIHYHGEIVSSTKEEQKQRKNKEQEMAIFLVRDNRPGKTRCQDRQCVCWTQTDHLKGGVYGSVYSASVNANGHVTSWARDRLDREGHPTDIGIGNDFDAEFRKRVPREEDWIKWEEGIQQTVDGWKKPGGTNQEEHNKGTGKQANIECYC
jgi:hypothetical protein